MQNNMVFMTFYVRLIDGKSKGSFKEMSESETIHEIASRVTIIGKMEVVEPSGKKYVFNRSQRPLEALKSIAYGSSITIFWKG